MICLKKENNKNAINNSPTVKNDFDQTEHSKITICQSPKRDNEGIKESKAKSAKKSISNSKQRKNKDRVVLHRKHMCSGLVVHEYKGAEQNSPSLFVDEPNIKGANTDRHQLSKGHDSIPTKAKKTIKYTLDDFNSIEKIGDHLVNVSPISTNYTSTPWKDIP